MASENATGSRPATILVVEDEVTLRLNTTDHLREQGFRVLEAATADEAMVVLESGERVDLLFSDVHTPGAVNGLDVARWVKQNRPDIRILLTSGVPQPSSAMEGLEDISDVIPKPYELSEVERLIGAELGSANWAPQQGQPHG